MSKSSDNKQTWLRSSTEFYDGDSLCDGEPIILLLRCLENEIGDAFMKQEKKGQRHM